MGKILHLNFNAKKNIFFVIVSFLIFSISHENGMFWDNVLFASKMGNQLYYNSIFNWTMPNLFDPGHPPFLGFLLAIFWNFFGYKLWVSHLLILPFTIGFFVQLFKFIGYFIDNKTHQFFAFLLIIIDPTLSTAFVLVNPEIIIIFFFFLAINSIFLNNNTLKVIGLFFLSIISFRSMMLFGGIFLFEILNRLILEKKNFKSFFNIKFLFPYILGSLPGVIFVIWRLFTKGWLQTHPNSPWAELWHIATPKIFFKNCIVLIWRYLDFGRIFIFSFIIISLFIFGKKIIRLQKNKQLFLLSISSVSFIIITILIATNAFGHRYFIVSYICIILFAFKILKDFIKSKKLIYSLLFIGLITGNLWIYPRSISQGWDATLGHLPYHSLRLQAIDYLNKESINVEEIASFFPNYTTLDLIDFRGDKRSFSKFTGKEKYVFYSNIYNLTDNELKRLDNNYTILKEFNNFNIYIQIYTLKGK